MVILAVKIITDEGVLLAVRVETQPLNFVRSLADHLFRLVDAYLLVFAVAVLFLHSDCDKDLLTFKTIVILN